MKNLESGKAKINSYFKMKTTPEQDFVHGTTGNQSFLSINFMSLQGLKEKKQNKTTELVQFINKTTENN